MQTAPVDVTFDDGFGTFTRALEQLFEALKVFPHADVVLRASSDDEDTSDPAELTCGGVTLSTRGNELLIHPNTPLVMGIARYLPDHTPPLVILDVLTDGNSFAGLPVSSSNYVLVVAPYAGRAETVQGCVVLVDDDDPLLEPGAWLEQEVLGRAVDAYQQQRS